MLDLLIKGASIIDGTGGDRYMADVAVKDGDIVKIAPSIDEKASTVIDAAGKILTPGFFDMHSHADFTAAVYPHMEGLLGQGVTTCFCGHCGMSVAPIDRYYLETPGGVDGAAISRLVPPFTGGPNPIMFRIADTEELRPAFKEVTGTELDWTSYDEFLRHLEKTGVGCNMIINASHSQIRIQVLGVDYKRSATVDEVEKMKEYVRSAMEAGASGLSYGLEYCPGTYADTYELTELARVVKEYDGVVTAHLQWRKNRRERDDPGHEGVDGVKEFLEIGKETGVRLHISHMLGGYTVVPPEDELVRAGVRRLLEVIDSYRRDGVQVTWDVLPYDVVAIYYFPQLATYMRPYVDECGGKQAFSRALKIGDYRNRITEEIKAGKHRSTSPLVYFDPVSNPDWAKPFLITKCSDARYVNKTIYDIAQESGKDSLDVLLDILSVDPEAGCGAWRPYPEARFYEYNMADDATMGLDNVALDYDYFHEDGEDLPFELGTPTAYCGMVSYIEQKLLPRLEDTIKRLTGNAASALRLTDRGYIKEGLRADIVVMDYDNLKSNKNFLDPRTPPSGIDYVIVNGEVAVDHNTHLHPHSGRIYRFR